MTHVPTRSPVREDGSLDITCDRNSDDFLKFQTNSRAVMIRSSYFVFAFLFVSDYLIAVGGTEQHYKPENNKTELFSRTDIWSTESDYPFGAEYS